MADDPNLEVDELVSFAIYHASHHIQGPNAGRVGLHWAGVDFVPMPKPNAPSTYLPTVHCITTYLIPT